MPFKRRGKWSGRSPADGARHQRTRGWQRRRAGFEILEDRRLLATLTVNTLVDENNGIGTGGVSLREAVAAAAANDTIAFSVTGTINLTSAGAGHIVVNKNLTIQGPGANLLTIKAFDPDAGGDNDSDGHRVFYVSNGSSSLLNVTISGLTLTNGDPDIADEDNSLGGGAIHNEENLLLVACVLTGNYAAGGGAIASSSGSLSVTDCVISGNFTKDGGAIILDGGSVSVTRSRLINNAATNSGGAILSRSRPVTVVDSTISGNHADEHGGGLYQYSSTLSVSGSTISGNVADTDTDELGYGGGIYNKAGSLTITSTTISGNSAGDDGGGIFSDTSQAVTISHSTITGNTVANRSGVDGGGIRSVDPPTLSHTIIAGNLKGSTRDDVSGSFDASYSLIGDRRSASVTNIVGSLIGTTASPINAMLGPLANNAGPTMTHALLVGSPAIDSGNMSAVAGAGGIPQNDQRGFPFSRVADGDGAGGARIDMGAYEKQSALNLVVDIAIDENDFNYSPGDLSLREALAIANGNAGVIDTISFGAALNGATIVLTLGELPITDGVTVTGLGANLLTVDATGNDATPIANEGNGSRVFNIDDGAAGTFSTVQISGLKLIGGDVTGAGGAILSRENLTLTAVTLDANHATTQGGGIKHELGSLTIRESTLSNNSAPTGGAIWTDTELATRTALIVSSTISGNTATVRGGGLHNENGLTLVRHSTVTNNTAPAGQGGGISSVGDANTLTEIQSTIVAGNSGSDVTIASGVLNSFQSDGYNVVGSGNAAVEFVEAGDRSGIVNPAVGALANNGGPTMTHALLLGSVAINTGDPAAAAGVGNVPLFDQRGNPQTRVFGGRIDVGAVEFQSPVSPLALNVDTLADENDGNFSTGDLSLREALAMANGNSGVADTISFSPALNSGSIVLSMGELSITDSVTITGLGANLLTIDGSGNDPTPLVDEGNGRRVFNIDDSVAGTFINVELSGLRLTGGDVAGGGSGVWNRENLTLTAVEVAANSATTQGGGIRHELGNLTIIDSLLTANRAAAGGGLWTDTDLISRTALITNSTISGNVATATGGGVHNENGLAVVRHSTITNNSAAANSGGGIASVGDANTRTEVRSTIIAANPNGDVAFVGGGINSFQSNNYNRVGSGNAIGEFVESGDLNNVANPMLGGLVSNGGPTATHLPQPGSPAIDAGDPAAVAGSGGVPQFDQRGSSHPRILHGRIDIGAVETLPPPAPVLPGDYNLDNIVDAADYVLWRRTQGSSVPAYSGADGNGDGVINPADYDVWRAHFGEVYTPPASAASVPALPPGTQPESASNEGSENSDPLPAVSVEPKVGSKSALGTAFQHVPAPPGSAGAVDLLLALEQADLPSDGRTENWPSQGGNDQEDAATAFDTALANTYGEPAASVGVRFDAF